MQHKKITSTALLTLALAAGAGTAGAAPADLEPDSVTAAYTALPCVPGGPTSADAAMAASLNPRLGDKMAGHMTPYNTSCARAVVESVKARGYNARAAAIAMSTVIVETSIANLDGGDLDSVGLYQQRASWGSFAQRTDPHHATGSFLSTMSQFYPNGSWNTAPIGDVAANVQRPAAEYRYRYAVEADDAIIIANALWGATWSGPTYHQVREASGTWTGFRPLNGSGTSLPAGSKDVAVSGQPDGSAQVVIVGADDQVYHRVRSASGAWTEFRALNGMGTTTPAKGSRVAITGLPDGSAQVLIVGADGKVYHRARAASGNWTEFAPLNGFGTTLPAGAKDVAIAGLPDGSSRVAIIGADDQVYHRIRAASGSWTEFAPLNGMGTSTPAKGSRVAIAGLPDGSAQLLIVGADGKAYHRAQDMNGTWTDFAPLNGYGTTAPAGAKAVAISGQPDGSAQVLIVGADDRIYHRIRSADRTWSGFAPLSGMETTSPAMGSGVAIAGLPDGSSHTLITGR